MEILHSSLAYAYKKKENMDQIHLLNSKQMKENINKEMSRGDTGGYKKIPIA